MTTTHVRALCRECGNRGDYLGDWLTPVKKVANPMPMPVRCRCGASVQNRYLACKTGSTLRVHTCRPRCKIPAMARPRRSHNTEAGCSNAY